MTIEINIINHFLNNHVKLKSDILYETDGVIKRSYMFYHIINHGVTQQTLLSFTRLLSFTSI